MSKYTPGPWRTHAGIYIRAESSHVATVAHDTAVDLANATLIAAAPELLAALEAIESAVTSELESCMEVAPAIDAANQIVRAAIAKAKGDA